jgi:hypothetical protein
VFMDVLAPDDNPEFAHARSLYVSSVARGTKNFPRGAFH